jgi:hypothetical protein
MGGPMSWNPFGSILLNLKRSAVDAKDKASDVVTNRGIVDIIIREVKKKVSRLYEDLFDKNKIKK